MKIETEAEIRAYDQALADILRVVQRGDDPLFFIHGAAASPKIAERAARLMNRKKKILV